MYRALIHRLQSRDQQSGFMLVAVIGLMAVGAIVVVIMAFATMRSISSTTAARANVQAQAAAQTGVEVALQIFSGDGSGCVGGVLSGTIDGSTFQAKLYPSQTATPFNADTRPAAASCPSSSSKSVYVESTGTAAAKGVTDASGDQVTVQALIELKENPEFSLDHAIFAGSNATLNNATEVLMDPAVNLPANVYAGGSNFTCHSGMQIQGSIYHRGGDNPQYGMFEISNGGCNVWGDIISNSNVNCHAGTNIWGDLVSHRNITFSNAGCKVGQKSNTELNPNGGDVTSGINTTSTDGYTANGTVTVNGNYSQSNSSVVVRGDLRVHGTINKGFGEANWNTWANDPNKLGGTVQQMSSPGAVPAVPVQTLPKFDDAWIAENFAGWARPGWRETFEPVRNQTWFNVCSPSGGNNVMGTLVINQDTVLDIRDEPNCNNGKVEIGYGLTIELNANLAIIGNGIHKNSDLTIKAGSAIQPGDPDPEIYFIEPHNGSNQECYSNGTANVWGWGAHKQPDSRTRVLIYAPSGFKTENSHKIRGQVYACHVTLSTSQQVIYAPVTGLGGADGSEEGQTRLVYLKDRG